MREKKHEQKRSPSTTTMSRRHRAFTALIGKTSQQVPADISSIILLWFPHARKRIGILYKEKDDIFTCLAEGILGSPHSMAFFSRYSKSAFPASI